MPRQAQNDALARLQHRGWQQPAILPVLFQAAPCSFPTELQTQMMPSLLSSPLFGFHGETPSTRGARSQGRTAYTASFKRPASLRVDNGDNVQHPILEG